MTSAPFPRVVWEFVAATNSADTTWMDALLTDDCVVDACGYLARGRVAVLSWSAVEFIGAGICVSILSVSSHADLTVVLADATDHGCSHRCTFEFRTRGHFIASLAIAI